MILEIIAPIFENVKTVLEIGSGTGQHAVHFASALPHLSWQCSDQASYLPGIRQWLNEANLANTPEPIELNVSEDPWPALTFDAVFSANTTHIMHWHNVIDFFTGISQCLIPGGHFCLYGPFNYNGEFTSESNERFDQWLKSDDPGKGVRAFESINELADLNKLGLVNDFAMPANNRILHWSKNDAA